MKIGRMIEGDLYKIKPNILLHTERYTGPQRRYKVLAGFREGGAKTGADALPPFVYLGSKEEDWRYLYQHTSRIHYILWNGDVWVMDNQFAKHIIPASVHNV